MHTCIDASPHTVPVRQWRAHAWHGLDETVSREERLHIVFENNQASLWAWPHALETLALGHIQLQYAGSVAQDTPVLLRTGTVEILPPTVVASPEHRLCVTLGAPLPPPVDVGYAQPQAILAHMQRVLEAPGLWCSTGCFHRAALLRLDDGHIVALHEDIGRHNCIDRLVGDCCLRNIHPGAYALYLSARITASMYAKIRRAGIAFMVSRAAVTTASWEQALAHGVTMIGFCRVDDARLTVFADTHSRVLV